MQAYKAEQDAAQKVYQNIVQLLSGAFSAINTANGLGFSTQNQGLLNAYAALSARAGQNTGNSNTATVNINAGAMRMSQVQRTADQAARTAAVRTVARAIAI
jgi:hypothetical protein